MKDITLRMMSVAALAAIGCSKPASQPTPTKTSERPRATAPASPTPTGGGAARRSAAEIGAPAPDFSLPGVDGQRHKLSALRGSVVVLEWFNPDCPFVKRAHVEGPLQDMAKRWQARGVKWLAINSSAPGKQGHGLQRNRDALGLYGLSHPLLLDEKGAVGRLYGAARTPQAYVISKDGVLLYAGALNNMPYGELTEPGAEPKHYLQQALAASLAGKPVKVASTKPWGCSVKYAK